MAKAKRRADIYAAQRAAERARLLREERQAKARAEENALEASLAQTVERGEAQGAEFDRQPRRRGEARKPIRRLTGLGWLLGKTKITKDQYEAGVRYGEAYRKAKGEVRIRSILNRDPAGHDGRTMAELLALSEEAVYAAQKLAMYRGMLGKQPNLVRACDDICGLEKTPRECAQNGRQAETLEALIMVSLDLLIQHLAPSREHEHQIVKAA